MACDKTFTQLADMSYCVIYTLVYLTRLRKDADLQKHKILIWRHPVR